VGAAVCAAKNAGIAHPAQNDNLLNINLLDGDDKNHHAQTKLLVAVALRMHRCSKLNY
jgi:hypothetical protein